MDSRLLSFSAKRRAFGFARSRLVCLALLWAGALVGQEVSNGLVTLRPVKGEAGWVGFEVLDAGSMAAVVRLSSGRVQLLARQCNTNPAGDRLVFAQLNARENSGLRFGGSDSIEVRLKAGDPYPVVSFDLTIESFDPAKWRAAVGAEPFHFLALYLADAEVWHQRGWLNATPLADRFPLLLDTHAGSPEISAYHYNRNWSYTPPLGAHPLPVIGLWAPQSKRYVGLEFQTTRLEDNSEKDIATGYRWEEDEHPAEAGQFVALVYPFGGQGYQSLEFPLPGARLKSRGTLLWSRSLPATADPNRFLWSFLWERVREQLPRVPAVPDVAWIPGGIRRSKFEGPAPGRLIGGVEKPFQVPGSKVLSGWGWHNESPTAVPARNKEKERMQELEEDARELARLAKKFQIDGEDCVFWEKPLEGEWAPEWGGKPVTTLHNANGFAAGRLFLGLYRDASRAEYLPIVDGVFNWAKHVVWTRNEFADVPSSPFAIGGTLSASFCLEYYMTFKDSPEAPRRERARLALELARAFTYRYMVMWPSDNNRHDNLDPSFLWEPNSGRDWTGAACANEVFWNLDTLAQTAVHTGDPVLMWALQGSLSRWHLLYQDVRKNKLADYEPGDMTEGYGLYAGNIYGLGARAGYGFASPLVMTEPVGKSALRVLAGEKAALAFRKGAESIEIFDYRYNAPGNLSFSIRTRGPKFDLSLTVPYLDVSGKEVSIIRSGVRIPMRDGQDLQRPPQALWSLYFKNLEANDRVLVGEINDATPLLPDTPPLSYSAFARRSAPVPRAPFDVDGYQVVPLSGDNRLDRDWEDFHGWPGLPAGRFWVCGIPFELPVPARRGAITQTDRFAQPLRDADFVYLLYSAGEGPAPSLVYADGQQTTNAVRIEALAWRAWPPIYHQRLLAAQIPMQPGRQAIGLNPEGRTVWAMTTLKLSEQMKAPYQSSLAALEEGAAEWKQMRREDAAVKALSGMVTNIPQGALAILPPKAAGQAYAVLQRAGLVKRAVVLDPGQLVDPAVFNPRRIPVALYLDGEDYVHTVRTNGDGAAALERYVKEGGTLILLPSLPWPLFYADGPGFHRPEALTGKLGLPLLMANEDAAPDLLLVRPNPQQSVIKLEAGDFPFPAADPRLRTIDRQQISNGVKYTPIAAIASRAGKDYGDAAGLIELPGGGRVLYIACNLPRDPDHGFAFLEGAFRFLLEASQKR